MRLIQIYIFTLLAQIMFIGGFIHADDSGLPNSSARPQTRISNVDIFADLLYWRATENSNWAIKLVSSSSSLETIHFKTVTFDWDPAFRVGIGYNMNHDQWDMQAYYTRFYTKATHHVSGENIQSAFLGSKAWGNPSYTSAKITMAIDFNIFDWDLGRNFLISRALSLRPFIGLKGGWIDQSLHTKWKNPAFAELFTTISLSAKENLKCDFLGGGPKGGANLKWMFGNLHKHFFSIFGDFSAAYMWGHWSIKDKLKNNQGFMATTQVGSRNFGALALQAIMGIGWDVNFNKDCSHFMLKLGYELQDWFDQYQIFDGPTAANNNDLQLQGLTLDVRLDF